MGPKKVKDVADENYWRTLIEEAVINEETWRVKVVMIESAGSDQDRIYLNKFEICAAEERRFVIKNICKTETIFMVNQLGGEKKVKDDSLQVFEEGQSYLKEKKDIPPDILALIIKHLILKLKEEYLFIKRQRLAVREGITRESATMVNRAEVKGSVYVKPPEPPEPPAPPPKGKGKKGDQDLAQEIPEPDADKKYNTLLRVRGEEWRDKVYVDDFPTDGPNLYVAITGFMEPYLAGCLINIGIPLTAVVQVRIDSSIVKVPSSLFRATKRGQSQTEVLGEKCLKFWEDLQQLRVNKDSDVFKNTAFVIFSPPYWNDDTLSGNPEKIYDEMCFLLYDIQDLTRQHGHYLDNMDIINIPEESKSDRNIKFYNNLLDDLPLEATTLYSVLDSILQTVVKNIQLEDKSSRSSLSTAATLNQNQDDNKTEKVEIFIKQVFNSLCKTDNQKKKYRVTYGEEYEHHKDPIIINFGDISKYNTFHLGNINLENIVWSMLSGMPVNKLWQNNERLSGDLEAKVNFHVNVLLSCFDRTDVETAELSRLIHILSCRKLFSNRSSLKKNHLLQSTITEFKKKFLKRSVLAEPLPKCPSIYRTFSFASTSFPAMVKSIEGSNTTIVNDDDEVGRIKFLFDCPDISELVSAVEIANEQPMNHIIDDFEYFEDFSGINAFQVMLEAFNKFNCVDYKYCEVTDSFVLMFFNSHDKDGISREEWRCHIATPLCLQDFFDFVLEEHYDWIQNEESIYDQHVLLRSQSQSKDLKDPLAAKSCVENNEVEVELLMEGSLKHQEFTQVEELIGPETTESKMSTSKKATSPISTTTNVDTKGSKKTKSPATSTPKHLRQSFLIPGPDSESTTKLPRKPFSGYDLGDRRVEVFGRDSIYFSKDGTRIATFYTLVIPMNLEYIILNVVPGNGNNAFWMHKALGENVKQEIVDTCESFRICTKDQVVIYIKKQTYEVPIITAVENSRPRESIMISPSPNISTLIQQMHETISYHSLVVTWPNGLITETVYENNSPIISHIKQFCATSLTNLDEDMRCISLSGEVVICKKNGDIDVFRPDGSFIKITKYQKRIVCGDNAEDIQSDISSDKNKKNKGKDKSKDKPSKASSKSSKNALSDDEKLSESKPDYELFIEEFETIETSGLRQRWIVNNSYDIEKLLIRTATDYCQGEIFSRRMDGTSILLNKDGIQVVTFPNNTRIITRFIIEEKEIFPEWTAEEIEYFGTYGSDIIETDTIKSRGSISQKSYVGPYNYSTSNVSSTLSKKFEEETVQKERTDGYISIHIIYAIEHSNFTTVTINKANGKISVDSPNNTSVTVDMENHYEFILDEVTTADFDGENLNINYEACTECQSNTKCKVKIMPDDMSSVTKIHKKWLQMKDSFSKNVIVNEEGNISVIDESCFDDVVNVEEYVNPEETPATPENTLGKPEMKSDNTVTTHGKCVQIYDAKAMKFFILKRELTCSELVHRVLVEQDKRSCRWQPWCSINQYDTFGDHRSLLSILTPVHLTESEKWFMDSKLADKPKYLSYKDLKPDIGKGFYHWMRPYERFQPKPMKPDNVLPNRLPRAYVLRTLEHQWSESNRNELKGARELLSAILRYRNIMESDSQTILNIPIFDLRPEDERRIDDIVQAVAHRVYEDLKIRLEDDVQSRARPTITTRPPPPPEEMSVEGELDEEATEEFKALEEERVSLVKEVEDVDEMSPTLKRYWRRRGEEFKEEEFYKYLLREGSVPPYFRNVLGGAIWWEMNNAAGEAATKAERRKMKCVCAGEGTSCTDNT